MDGVWIHFHGLPTGATREDVEYLASGLAHRIEFDRRGRRETSGRFYVQNIDGARHVLGSSNFTMLDGHMVRLSMGLEYLSRCVKVAIRGVASSVSGEDMRLYEYCRRFGMVCKLEVMGAGAANVWFDTEDAAMNAVAAFNGQRSLGSGVQAYIDGVEREVIVLDDDESAMVIDSTSSLGTDGVIRADRDLRTDQIQKRVLRKRIGRKSARAAAKAPPELNGANGANGANGSRKPSAARKSAGRRASGMQGSRRGTVVRAEPTHVQGANARGKRRWVRDVVDRQSWRQRAPFIYEFIYRRVPEPTAVDDGSCLSMAMSWSAGSGRMVECFLSQGNVQAASLVQDWAQVRQTSDDVASAITQTTFDIPQRGQMANIKSLLGAFTSDEVPVLHKNQKKDDYNQAIAGLKLRDAGRVLFGCAMDSVMVWTTDAIRHHESLVLLDGVDGVYDAGRDYVVANSKAGEVGVWKSASRNYMWRYNDTRRFRGLLPEPPRVSALHVAPSDAGAFVGDSLGGLAFCDFREPYIQRLASAHSGAIGCIEAAGDHGLIVGSHDGHLALLDTRFVRADARASVVRQYPSQRGRPTHAIRTCPHDPNVFAVAVGAIVYIYSTEPRDSRSLLFTHDAHQSPVMDLCWHPSPEFPYTIGSAELGTNRGSGEIQIWRPSSMIF
ncbi:hypothetical protein GGF43_003693 [Coemansia sp. RSA 2618]|nr:hypothetical protein GGF43_003693 [Coemansia sp. RSA 2618]